ncbi:HalOD1 output domain-containing protein [Halorarum salinum]|uniref:Halobacterial output domain-containing protein n=1 Tax=Halorarum salinum TaxID=2743089 RepID=A0A7D5QBH5_9EURY|nr:HalOD1 output domain-containing protein [Halobaculum salinum]QLG63376.1 hypothetical protein HUG12_17200 [Halobaculum salinum]
MERRTDDGNREHEMRNDDTRNDEKRDDVVRDAYTTDQDRSLTDAMLGAIERCKGDDLTRDDFVLYEDVNPDALDSLFRHDAEPRTEVTFATDGVEVELWGDGGVEIRVGDATAE